jgi:hypothetical protein
MSCIFKSMSWQMVLSYVLTNDYFVWQWSIPMITILYKNQHLAIALVQTSKNEENRES